jgi:hypothetical protein
VHCHASLPVFRVLPRGLDCIHGLAGPSENANEPWPGYPVYARGSGPPDRALAVKSVMTPHEGYIAHEPHGYFTGDYPHGGVVTGDRAGLRRLATRPVRFSLVAYTTRLREAWRRGMCCAVL